MVRLAVLFVFTDMFWSWISYTETYTHFFFLPSMMDAFAIIPLLVFACPVNPYFKAHSFALHKAVFQRFRQLYSIVGDLHHQRLEIHKVAVLGWALLLHYHRKSLFLLRWHSTTAPHCSAHLPPESSPNRWRISILSTAKDATLFTFSYNNGTRLATLNYFKTKNTFHCVPVFTTLWPSWYLGEAQVVSL